MASRIMPGDGWCFLWNERGYTERQRECEVQGKEFGEREVGGGKRWLSWSVWGRKREVEKEWCARRGEEVGWKEQGRMMELRLPSAGRWNVAHGGEISFTANYKQGEGADGSCRNQDERRERKYGEKERKMKLLLNGTNHRREVIRAVGNHYNDNMVWHDSYSTQRKSFARAGEEIGRRAAS